MRYSTNRSIRSLAFIMLMLLTISSSSVLTRPSAAQSAVPTRRVPRPLPKPEVEALLKESYHALNTGKLDAAEKSFNDALAKAQTLKDGIGEATALRGLGNVAASHSQHSRALDFYEKALAMFRSAGDVNDEAVTLNNVGSTYYQMSQPPKAREYFQKALDLFRATGEKNGEAQALVNLGNVYWILGQPEKARENYLLALPLHQAEGDKNGEARALMNIGFLYLKSGQPKTALEYFLQALPVFTAEGDIASEAAVLTRIGVVYANTGQPQTALEYLLKALPLQKAAGDQQSEATSLTNIGNAYGSLGQHQKAIEIFLQALSITRKIHDGYGEATLLANLGIAYFDLGEPQKSLDYYQQALPLLKASGNRNFEAGTLYNLGDAYAHIQQPQKALEYYQRAYSITTNLQDREGESFSLSGIGNMERELGRRADAETHLREAVLLTEDFRSRLGGYTTAKSSFLASKMDRYYDYLKILIQNDKPAEAFSIVQKTKARSLLDLLYDGKVDLSRSLTPEERKEEQELNRQVGDLNELMIREGAGNSAGAKQRLTEAADKLREAESKFQTFTDTLYARHPDLASKRAARTTTLADVAQFLPADTALLDYVVLSGDQVRLFVVTARQGKATLHTYAIQGKYALLQKQITAFQAACSDPTKPYQQEALALYRLLIAPAESDLAGRRRLLLCPDQALWNVPFAALLSPSGSQGKGNVFLAERFEIDYAYSATGMQAALQTAPRQNRPAGSILVVAYPDFGETTRFGEIDNLPGQRSGARSAGPLEAPSRAITRALSRGNTIAPLPGTKREAEDILRLYPDALVLTGEAAQEATVKQQAGNYRYLHLATHGFLNDAAPLLSSIVLAKPNSDSKEDGFLTAREVFDLKLNADLVVLSACNTGRGQIRTGEGVVGLTWAFFVAGAPTQVVSQWSVDDAATAETMMTFYRNLKAGKSKGVSLREAALALLPSSNQPTARNLKSATGSGLPGATYRHPYYWAPFVLIGDWR